MRPKVTDWLYNPTKSNLGITQAERKMALEDVSTIVFGVVASVLALITILQAYLKGRGSRGRYPADRSKTGRWNNSNVDHIRTGLRSSPTMVRSSTHTPNQLRWPKSTLDPLGPAQYTSGDGTCLATLAGSWYHVAARASSSRIE